MGSRTRGPRAPAGLGGRAAQWNAQERLWSATAFYTGHVHVFDRRPTVVTRGMTEAEALRELAEVLRTR